MSAIEILSSHLNKYKDAIIIFGTENNKAMNDFLNKEELKDLNKKNLYKHPEKFWNLYKEHILIENNFLTESEKKLLELTETGAIKTVVELNGSNLSSSDLNCNLIKLLNSRHMFECVGIDCKTIYTSDYVFSEDGINYTCEKCGKKLRPKYVIPGFSFDDSYNILKEEILKTHTLIIIGLDYKNEVMVNLIKQFHDNKMIQMISGSSDPIVNITILDKDNVLSMEDINDIGFNEFFVKDDTIFAMDRLINIIKNN